MKKIISIVLIFISFSSFGQIENRWQPDSIYSDRRVKKIFVYLNSPKDLSEIVEFDKNGKRIRVEKYSASHNSKTRKSKNIDLKSHYVYNSQGLLIQIIDSVIHYNNLFSVDRKLFEYDSNNFLVSEKYFKGKFENPYSTTTYSYNPFKSTTIRQQDSIVIYEKTKEFEKDFYVKRFYGFYLEPKLKNVTDTINGIPNTLTYKDYGDLEKFEDNKTIKNNFDLNGLLIKSDVRSVFMNDRVTEYELNYKYYKNGLLKSIRGYVPRYFKYEYWE